MSERRALFVKLSSLGDVVHHFPAVTDLRRHRPEVRIAWAVEQAYAPLVRLHPAVDEAIPVGLRALRDRPASLARWSALAAARREIGRQRWDYVVDSQGLLKSAWIARAARAATFGYDRRSAREPAASRFYDVRVGVDRRLHAVERNRLLVAEIFGYTVEGAPDYGLDAGIGRPPWAPERYCVLLHAASRAPKRWPEPSWIVLGQYLAQEGYACVLPAGNAAERADARRLAARIEGALVAPAMGLAEAAALLANASKVVGVDTGLTHLAVALRRPTVGIYCATEPTLTGLCGEGATNVGGARRVPTVDEVGAALGLASPTLAA